MARTTKFVPWAELLTPGEKIVQETVGHDEQRSTVLRCYCDCIVPGLLQTRPYARAILGEVIARFKPDDDLEAAVDARVGRQMILTRPGRSFRFVLHEQALYTRVGGTEVMRGQLDHLKSVARHGISGADLSLGLLPRTTSFDGWLPTRAFTVHDDVAREECVAGELTIADRVLAEGYRRAFALVTSKASHGPGAIAVIQEAERRLEQ